jgi:hypothetical protein
MGLSGIWSWVVGLGALWIIIIIVLLFVLQTIFLMIGIKAVKGKERKFGNVFLTAIINWVCTFIPIIGCVLQWIVINSRHKTGFGNAILAWLIAILVPIGIMIGLIFLFGAIGLIPALF